MTCFIEYRLFGDSRPVTAIEDARGNLLKEYPSKCQQVLPGADEETVCLGDQWKIGGGTMWGWISYDPELNLIFYGTANPGPWNPDQRPGDNKWTCGIFARNPDTGVANMAAFTRAMLEELKDVYHAEGQLLKALPKMAKASANEQLAEAFQKQGATVPAGMSSESLAFGVGSGGGVAGSEQMQFVTINSLDVAGATVGLVGFGRIARRVAELLRCFEVRLLFTSRSEAAAQHGGERRVQRHRPGRRPRIRGDRALGGVLCS